MAWLNEFYSAPVAVPVPRLSGDRQLAQLRGNKGGRSSGLDALFVRAIPAGGHLYPQYG